MSVAQPGIEAIMRGAMRGRAASARSTIVATSVCAAGNRRSCRAQRPHDPHAVGRAALHLFGGMADRDDARPLRMSKATTEGSLTMTPAPRS
jgi:hypothetical protein